MLPCRAAGYGCAGDVEAARAGVCEFKKPGSQARAVGDRIHWDDTARRTTGTTTSNTLAGVATGAVAGGTGDAASRRITTEPSAGVR